MKLLIHDLSEDQWVHSGIRSEDYWKIIADDKNIKHCIGCFGCWIVTPGECVIKDAYQQMGSYIGQSTEMVIVSRCLYGGFSPFIKNVLDRSISYIHPYFVIRNKEMHHKNRYPDPIAFRVAFYGDSLTDAEKETARKLVTANAINFEARDTRVLFFDNLKSIGEWL